METFGAALIKARRRRRQIVRFVCLAVDKITDHERQQHSLRYDVALDDYSEILCVDCDLPIIGGSRPIMDQIVSAIRAEKRMLADGPVRIH